MTIARRCPTCGTVPKTIKRRPVPELPHDMQERMNKAIEEVVKREEEAGLERGWAWEFLPVKAPKGWQLIEALDDGAAWFTPKRGCKVIATCALEEDGKRWMHVSVSTDVRAGLPWWEDFRDVVRELSGERFAYQVIPPEDEHIDLHPVLHAFVLLEDPPARGQALPDFSAGTGSI